MSIEAKIAEFTAQQVSDLLFELTFKTVLSAVATVMGGVGGVNAENEVMRYGLFILGVLGAIGLLVWFPQLIELAYLLPQR